MREILKALNIEAGTNGCMVITPDGIMVAAALSPNFEEDSVAAFAASLILLFKRNLASIGVRGELRSCSITASQGKLVFIDMTTSYLVLIADPKSDIDSTAAPVQAAITKIANRRIS